MNVRISEKRASQMKAPMLKSFRLRNFKAVRDSGAIKFTPLTVFIGNNGPGKSSIIEGLETLQWIVDEGLDKAMQQWHGFEHVWNKGVRHEVQVPGEYKGTRFESMHTNPMSFELQGKIKRGAFTATMELNTLSKGNQLLIQDGSVAINNQVEMTISPGIDIGVRRPPANSKAPFNEREFGRALDGFISEWQFVSLIPQSMGSPTPQKRTVGPARLLKDGSNIADYLLDIRRIDKSAFESIVAAMQYVLPYARDLQPELTSELERTVYLQLTEGEFNVPGWLLSTGTLRLLALLALLHHPTPPPLLVIEELENGLDPRSIHLIVEEIRNAVESGKTPVIATTHSPYLLDLLSLSHIVLVERVDGQPTFIRPADQKLLQDWAKNFGPGRLYTMNRLGGEGRA